MLWRYISLFDIGWIKESLHLKMTGLTTTTTDSWRSKRHQRSENFAAMRRSKGIWCTSTVVAAVILIRDQ